MTRLCRRPKTLSSPSGAATCGLLRSFDKNLEQVARQPAVDDIARAARKAGILADADKRGREKLQGFLKRAGFEQIEFR